LWIRWLVVKNWRDSFVVVGVVEVVVCGVDGGADVGVPCFFFSLPRISERVCCDGIDYLLFWPYRYGLLTQTPTDSSFGLA
jgi:hypothetical protein